MIADQEETGKLTDGMAQKGFQVWALPSSRFSRSSRQVRTGPPAPVVLTEVAVPRRVSVRRPFGLFEGQSWGEGAAPPFLGGRVA